MIISRTDRGDSGRAGVVKWSRKLSPLPKSNIAYWMHDGTVAQWLGEKETDNTFYCFLWEPNTLRDFMCAFKRLQLMFYRIMSSAIIGIKQASYWYFDDSSVKACTEHTKVTVIYW